MYAHKTSSSFWLPGDGLGNWLTAALQCADAEHRVAQRLGVLLSGRWVPGRRDAAAGLLTALLSDAWTEGDGREVLVIELVDKARSVKRSTPDLASRQGAVGNTSVSATVGVTNPVSDLRMPCTRGGSWRA
jgi:hypothetical protein